MKITSDTIDPTLAVHGFFGRKYGKSSGAYASLNCSKFVGDNPAAVLRNLEIVRRDLGAKKLITLKQVHGNVCIVADDETESDVEADAVVTRIPGIGIGVLTADCAPVLLADKKTGTVGAAHAGWRGAVAGVLESAIRKMRELGSDPRDIVAVIGPCISPDSCETDEEFAKNFKRNEVCLFVANSKLHFDLPRYCLKRLTEAGVPENGTDFVDVDTFASPEDYFSYRFANRNSKGICGRQISAICPR
ncbi:MAG: peptidoglycan editing factor PgeF [Holosporaceae bacterium]|nr:peptidoglycan editing factor PgeF [Holosporaceae bacterium]